MTSDCCEQGRDWKSVKINDKDYMICFTKENESWKILLTNLIEIYVEILTDKTMFHKCQTLNPLLNLEAFDWKQMIMNMLNNIPKCIRTCVAEVSTYQIELRRDDNDFIKLKFSLDLVKGTSEQFWEYVTMPLCLSSTELIRQHEILLNLVKRKDEEIAEYKAEGAELIRKYIATKPFSQELFDTVTSTAIDFVKTFQSMLRFYNGMSLSKSHVKMESEIISDSISDNNILKINEYVSSDSPKKESVNELRLDEIDKDEQMHSKVDKCEHKAGPSSKDPTLRINNTSYTIHKINKKKKKALSDFIL